MISYKYHKYTHVCGAAGLGAALEMTEMLEGRTKRKVNGFVHQKCFFGRTRVGLVRQRDPEKHNGRPKNDEEKKISKESNFDTKRDELSKRVRSASRRKGS